MRSILQEHNADLLHVTKFCLKGFAAELFANKLICIEVKNSPTFNNIIGEFEAGINIENDASKLIEKWELFCQSLRKQEGPAMMLAMKFKKKMNSENNEANLSNLKFVNFLQDLCNQAETSTDHSSDDSDSESHHSTAKKKTSPNDLLNLIARTRKRLLDESRIVETRSNKDEKAGIEIQFKEESKIETSVNPSTKINEETDSSDPKNEDKEEAGMPRVSELSTVQGIVILSLVLVITLLSSM